MIDPSKERLITFKQASQLVAVPVSMHTIRNWALTGAHGVKLEFVKIGARFFTSSEALHRFLDRCQANDWRGIWNGKAYEKAIKAELANKKRGN
ncbi:MAG TPA: DUF1580 domain-containing protein [Lacipirellulaceae bacterium]|nr:DUF1580 domain-containing protein [Lacipirellulaceae bacterium]